MIDISIPGQRSSRWFLLGAVLALLTCLIFILFYAVIFGHSIDNLNIGGIILFFGIIFQLIALAGYMSWFVLSVTALLGLCMGMTVFLSSIAKNIGGFEGLVSAIAMMMLIIAGFALGIILEFARFVWRKMRQRRAQSDPLP